MGKMQRDKGLRGERELVNLCLSAGLQAERQPLSGSLKNKAWKNDVKIELPAGPVLSAEVKLREKFSDYPLIEGAAENTEQGEIPVLIKRGNRKNFLLTLYLEDFLNLIELHKRDPKEIRN